MPAEWTTPITWNVDQLVTNTDLNEQLRDNLEYLLSPNHERIFRDNSGDYTITNVTSFQDIDGTNLSIDLETHGGPVLVNFAGVMNLGSGEQIMVDIAIDGTRVGTAYSYGLWHLTNNSGGGIEAIVGGVVLLTGLAAGTYELRPQWRTVSGSSIQLRSATTENPIIFEAIEL